MRRARLRRVVVAAVSGCALIIVAAGIVRVVHASGEPARAPQAAATAPAATVIAAAAAAPGPSPASAPATPDTAGASTATATTGTLRLERNLQPRSVWLDGRKLGTRNEVVTCGPHQLKVSRARARAIDVPCGGELRVAH